MQIGMRMQNMR